MLPAPRRFGLCLTVTLCGCQTAALSAAPFARPLNSPAETKADTLFTAMPASATGITAKNRFDDPTMWSSRFAEFTSGSLGTGVAVGDYDRDGRPDLYVVCKTAPGRLYRNRGDWRFEDVTETAGLRAPAAASSGMLGSMQSWIGSLRGGETPAVWHQGASFTDVNNDGWPDLYVCRTGAPNLLFVNRGDGTFAEEGARRGLAVNDASTLGVWCDFDRDGWLDVFVQTTALNLVENPAGQPDYLFRNRGDGTFEDVTARAGITGRTLGHSATWWDYNDDRRPDLYLANDFSLPDALYRNNGDGTFTNVAPQALPHVPYSGMGSNAADLDNDGLSDLLVADMAATTHEKDQRTMAGARAVTSPPLVAPGPLQYPRNALFLGTGTEACREAAYLAGLEATDWTWSLLLDDLDNDGRVDVFVTTGMVREQHNQDLLEQSMRLDSTEARVALMRSSPVFAEKNRAYQNRGALEFREVGKPWGLDSLGVSFGCASADFDNDGDLDLVVANLDTEPTLLRNTATAGNRILFDLKGRRSNRPGIGARVEIETAAGKQVRWLAAAHGYLSGSEQIVHFGLGEASHVRRVTVSWPSGVTQTFDNLEAGFRYTLEEADVSPSPHALSHVAIPLFARAEVGPRFLGPPPTGPVADPLAHPFQRLFFGDPGPAIAAQDIDGDGIDEVLLGAAGAEGLAQVVGELRSGLSVRPWAGGAGARRGDGPLLIANLAGTERPEVLLAPLGTKAFTGGKVGRIRLLGGDESLPVALAESLNAIGIAVGALAAADFDRDGDLDVFVGARLAPGAYPTTPRSMLLRNEGGRLVDVDAGAETALARCGLVTSALWTDVDDDGWLDLLVTTEWGQVRCFRNEQSGFTDVSERLGFAAAGTGWWSALAGGDFNADGRMDYVVGNIGLNTRYRSTRECPAVLLRGQFGARGKTQLIEARFEGEKLFPWKTRRELGLEIPVVLRTFPSNNAYARATVEEILGPERVQAAARWEVTETENGVFLSNGQGGWTFRKFPRMAQLGPTRASLTGDFDGDGCEDILLFQNSNQYALDIGQQGGSLGVLLRGDGAGGFTPASVRDSGVVVQGFPTGAGLTDLDHNGSPDVVVARNSAGPLALLNQARDGARWLALRLADKPGNVSAVGSRVVATRASARRWTGEVYGGGAGLSQSTNTLFLAWVDADPLTQVEVRWPDGDTRRYDLSGKPGQLTLRR